MSDPAFPYDVFLSPSAKDQAVVRPLAERLRTCRAVAARRRRKDGRQGKAECRRQKADILHSAFILHPSLCAFGSDWAQWEAGACGRRNLRFRDPLKRERRFMPLRLDGIRQTRFETGGWPRHQRPF
jgi:hypothetical protein